MTARYNKRSVVAFRERAFSRAFAMHFCERAKCVLRYLVYREDICVFSMKWSVWAIIGSADMWDKGVDCVQCTSARCKVYVCVSSCVSKEKASSRVQTSVARRVQRKRAPADRRLRPLIWISQRGERALRLLQAANNKTSRYTRRTPVGATTAGT